MPTDPILGPRDQTSLRHIELDASRVSDCMLLSDAAGWNQTQIDWGLMIGGHGFGVLDTSTDPASLVATAVLVPYPPSHAWISMVLVRKDWQRCGLATRLLGKCIALSERLGLKPLLDATPAGKHVYEQLGFDSCGAISRFVFDSETQDRSSNKTDAAGSRLVGQDGQENGGTYIRRISEVEVSQLVEKDSIIFGANRGPLISLMIQQFPALAKRMIDEQNQSLGYVLGREGRLATQIGPLVAESHQIALALLDNDLMEVRATDTGRNILIDVPDLHSAFQQVLVSRGFKRQRQFTRMQYGGCQPFGEYEKIFAIGGPEIG